MANVYRQWNQLYNTTSLYPTINKVLCGSENIIPESPNTAYSYRQYGPVTAWFGLADQETLYLFQKHPLCWEQQYIVYRNGIASVELKFCVLL